VEGGKFFKKIVSFSNQYYKLNYACRNPTVLTLSSAKHREEWERFWP